MENFRKIKTSKKIVRRKYDKKWVPVLMLQGEWLKEAGFSEQMNCSIKVENGRIIILNL